jgi:ferredoxin-thioredoxin reductase catalytic chain
MPMATQIEPEPDSVRRIERFVKIFAEKSGTTTHPDPVVTNAVVQGLARNLDVLGRPLCPCRFYPDPTDEIRHRTWICACDDMQIYKYCHCLLFVNASGQPITEYLPEDHVGRRAYGVVNDPTPDKGRALRGKAAERERERLESTLLSCCPAVNACWRHLPATILSRSQTG